MKAAYQTQTLIAALVLLAASASAIAADPVYHTFFGSKAIEGYDAVAYHTEKKPVKGTKKYSFEWQGANWYFSSAANLATFKSGPAKYAPQYGGYCAWAASEKNALVKTDPNYFDLHDGKLYLNFNKETQQGWRADKEGMIQRADKNYPVLITK